MINFGLLLFVLYLVLYKPVLQMLDERKRRIQESMENAETIKKALARTREDYEARMNQARLEAQKVVGQAAEIGERLKNDVLAQARQQADEQLARAKAQIQRETEQAKAELRAQVADLAILAATKVIKRSLDRPTHHQLIEEVLAETEKLEVEEERK